MSSLLPISLLLLLKKDNIADDVSLMNTEWPDASWSLCLVPAKKNGRAELEEELEMREGTVTNMITHLKYITCMSGDS